FLPPSTFLLTCSTGPLHANAAAILLTYWGGFNSTERTVLAGRMVFGTHGRQPAPFGPERIEEIRLGELNWRQDGVYFSGAGSQKEIHAESCFSRSERDLAGLKLARMRRDREHVPRDRDRAEPTVRERG